MNVAKKKNSVTESEALENFAEERAKNPDYGNDPNPPNQAKTRKTRDVKPIIVELVVSEHVEDTEVVYRTIPAMSADGTEKIVTELAEAEAFVETLPPGGRYRLIRVLAEVETVEEKRTVVKRK